jgi:hypothetical protein
VLDLDGRSLRLETRFVGDVADRVSHQVRPHVEEQQQAREHEERDNEEHGDDADEDVREDQLLPDAPEQPALRADDQVVEEVAGPDDHRQAGQFVEHADCGSTGAGDQARQEREHLDDQAAHEEPARQRTEKCLARRIHQRRASPGRQRSAAESRHHPASQE